MPQPSSEASTPAQSVPPYSPPVDQHTVHQTTPDYQNPPPQDRGGPLGGLGGLASGILGGGGKHSGSHGKIGLASSLLGGGKHSSGHSSGHAAPAAGLAGLAGGLLGGKKQHGGHGGGGGGLLGMAGGLASGLLNQVYILCFFDIL